MQIEICDMVISILFLLKLKKKNHLGFSTHSMVQMHSEHLGFFWFWSDKEMKMEMLGPHALFHDRFQQRCLQREMGFATSCRHPLGALLLIVSC